MTRAHVLALALLSTTTAFAEEPNCGTATFQSLDLPDVATCKADAITDGNRAALQRAQAENHDGLEFIVELPGGADADTRLRQTAAKAPWLAGLSISDVTNLAPLKALKRLRRLEIYSLELKDLSAIAGLTQLETLILKLGEPVDLAVIAKLPKLKRLRLDLRQDVDPKLLESLTNLVELRIDAKLANVDGVARLGKLEVLALSGGVAITSSQVVAGLRGLKHLQISAKGLHELDGLKQLTALVTLDLSQSGVARLDAIGGLAALQKLDLSGTPVADVTPIVGLASLEDLRLSDTKVRDVGAMANGLPRLRNLTLDGSLVTDARPLLPRAKGLHNLRLPKGVDKTPFTKINRELF